MRTRDDLTTLGIIERAQDLARQVAPARFLPRLRPTLQDPAYTISPGRFDWDRFAGELFPDLDPPLETWELHMALRDAGYAPPGHYDPPRNRIWWVARAFVDAADPVGWLLEQQEAGRKWTEVAEQLGCGLDNVRLSQYVSRQRKKRGST